MGFPAGYPQPPVIPIGYGPAQLACGQTPQSVVWNLKFPTANGSDTYGLSIQTGAGSAQFQQIQSAYIDNTGSAFDTTITFQDGQSIVAPAYSRGFYSCATNATNFTAVNEAGQAYTTTASVRVALYNVAIPPYIDYATAPMLGNNDQVVAARVGNLTFSGSVNMDTNFSNFREVSPQLAGEAAGGSNAYYYVTNLNVSLQIDKAAIADTLGVTFTIGDWNGASFTDSVVAAEVFFSTAGPLAWQMCNLQNVMFFGQNTFGFKGSSNFSGANLGVISLSVSGGTTNAPLF